MTKVRFRNLGVKNQDLKSKLLKAVEEVLDHGQWMLGPEVGAFEEYVAGECGRRHAIGVGSGTVALYLALKSLGIGHGDEVITTPLSWVATLNAITLTGATPVFVDIREDFNIDETLIRAAISSKTKALLPVHMMGKMCQMEPIVQLAKEYDLHLVEDAAQAFGAKIEQGAAGSFGTLGCFSMNPMKTLAAVGEAGVIVTDSDELAEDLFKRRYLGALGGNCQAPELNGKIDTLQAAMLLVLKDVLHEKLERSFAIARLYSQELDGLVVCPEVRNREHVFLSYTVLTEHREQLNKYLNQKGVESKIQYPLLMPEQDAYRGQYELNTPVAKRCAAQMLSLPNQDGMSLEEAQFVVEKVKEFFKS